jgi:hypothetical protein
VTRYASGVPTETITTNREGRYSFVGLPAGSYDVTFSAINFADVYTSRLPGEPDEGVDDVHTHPTPPRSVRAIVRVQF